jgi:hypothetical protein
MNTYLVVREQRAGARIHTVKVVVPDGLPEPPGFYAVAHAAHADADRLAALKPLQSIGTGSHGGTEAYGIHRQQDGDAYHIALQPPARIFPDGTWACMTWAPTCIATQY